MVVQVQYEALGNSQVAVPDLLAAYAQGKEIKNRQKQYDLANRQGEMSLKKQEMELPYYKDQLENQKKQGEMAIEKYGRDKMMTWVEYAKNFIPRANTVQDLMGMLKGAEDYLDMDPEISKAVLSGIPESAINNPEEFSKVKESLLYGTQLFEFNLKKSLLEQQNKFDVSLNETEFNNKKELSQIDNAAAMELESRRGKSAIDLQNLRNQGEIEQAKLTNERYQNTRTPSLLGKLYQEQQQFEPGSDQWNTYQDKIDNYSNSGAGTLSPIGKMIKEQQNYKEGTPEHNIYKKRLEKYVSDNGGLTYPQARAEAVKSLELNMDAIDFTMQEREQYITDYIDNMKKNGVPISGSETVKQEEKNKNQPSAQIKSYDPSTRTVTLSDGKKFRLNEDNETLSPLE